MFVQRPFLRFHPIAIFNRPAQPRASDWKSRLKSLWLIVHLRGRVNTGFNSC